MRSHFLANHSSVAAQKYGHRGCVRACSPLSNLEHLPPVDCAILALTACGISQLKLSELLICKAGIPSKLLDGIIQGPEEKNKALASVSFLCKIPAHDTSRDIQVDCFIPHGPHLLEFDTIRLEFGVGGPFEQLVPVSIAGTPNSMMCKHLKL